MLQETINNFIDRVSSSTFDLVSAAIIGFFGWYFGYVIGNKASEKFARTKINHAMKRLGWESVLKRFWPRATIAGIFGKAAEACVLLFFLMVSAGILQLATISQFFLAVLLYIINIFVAFFILCAAVLLVDFCQMTLIANLEKEKFVYSHFLAKVASGTIWTLAALAILYQLKIIAPLILVIFIGIVVTISISVGLALGLGGKDLAAKILKEIEERIGRK